MMRCTSLNTNIPVNDTTLVEELEAANDLGRVELGPLLVEAAHLLDVKHEVSAIQVLHHEEQVTLKDEVLLLENMPWTITIVLWDM